MKITLFTTDVSCADLGEVQASHITMFGKNSEITVYFNTSEEQLKFINLLIKNYVLFSCQGKNITLLFEANNHQRVRYRFD